MGVVITDTAFLLGVLALLGPACPPQLRVFLLALAIADDVGVLSVIALFYIEDLALGPLAPHSHSCRVLAQLLEKPIDVLDVARVSARKLEQTAMRRGSYQVIHDRSEVFSRLCPLHAEYRYV